MWRRRSNEDWNPTPSEDRTQLRPRDRRRRDKEGKRDTTHGVRAHSQTDGCDYGTSVYRHGRLGTLEQSDSSRNIQGNSTHWRTTRSSVFASLLDANQSRKAFSARKSEGLRLVQVRRTSEDTTSRIHLRSRISSMCCWTVWPKWTPIVEVDNAVEH